MIKQLYFSNFKSWKLLDIPKLSKLTAFFGTNSSGKTSILQFLLLLKQTVESSDRSQVLNFGTKNDYIELGSYKDSIFNHEDQQSITYKLEWLFDKKYDVKDTEVKGNVLFSGNNLLIEGTINQTKNRRLFIQEFAYTFANNKFTMKKQEKDKYSYRISAESLSAEKKYSLKRTPGRVWELPEPVKFYGFPDQVRTYYQNAGFLFDLQLRVETLFSNIYYLGPLRDYPQRQYTWTGSQPSDMGRRGEKAIDAMLVSRQENKKISRGHGKKRYTIEEYVAYWLKELDLIHSFRIDVLAEGSNLYKVLVKKTSTSAEVLITDVGFGVSQIIPIITLCYYAPDGSTLLIEQPEIHLHPKVQAGLADVFIDAIEAKNLQIILESHSEHLLRRLQRRIADDSYKSDDIKLFFCKTENSQSKIEQLDIDMFGVVRNWPENFFGDEVGEYLAINEAIAKRKTSK